MQTKKSSKWSHLRVGFIVKLLITLVSPACLIAACLGGAATPSSPGLPADSTPPASTPTAPSRPTLPATPSTSEATREVQPSPSPQPAQQAAATATPAEGQAEITIGDYYFYPQVVTVTVGTTVTWMPVGYLVHTIVTKNDATRPFRGDTAGAGTPPFEFTFHEPGVYPYYCDYHPGAMDAWIVVIEDE